MENWKRKVSEAIEEFKEAKGRENQAISALESMKDGPDQVVSAKLMKNWLTLQRIAQQKNDDVLRMIENVPKKME